MAQCLLSLLFWVSEKGVRRAPDWHPCPEDQESKLISQEGRGGILSLTCQLQRHLPVPWVCYGATAVQKDVVGWFHVTRLLVVVWQGRIGGKLCVWGGMFFIFYLALDLRDENCDYGLKVTPTDSTVLQGNFRAIVDRDIVRIWRWVIGRKVQRQV